MADSSQTRTTHSGEPDPFVAADKLASQATAGRRTILEIVEDLQGYLPITNLASSSIVKVAFPVVVARQEKSESSHSDHLVDAKEMLVEVVVSGSAIKETSSPVVLPTAIKPFSLTSASTTDPVLVPPPKLTEQSDPWLAHQPLVSLNRPNLLVTKDRQDIEWDLEVDRGLYLGLDGSSLKPVDPLPSAFEHDPSYFDSHALQYCLQEQIDSLDHLVSQVDQRAKEGDESVNATNGSTEKVTINGDATTKRGANKPLLLTPSPTGTPVALATNPSATDSSKSVDDHVFYAGPEQVIRIEGSQGYSHIDLSCFELKQASFQGNRITVRIDQHHTFDVEYEQVLTASFASGEMVQLCGDAVSADAK